MDEFRNNPDLFSSGGVIGRMDYFINQFKIVGLMFIVAIPLLFGLATQNSILIFMGTICSLIAFLPLIYFGFQSTFRRVRDIRGSTKDELIIIIALHIAFTIPFIGGILGLIVSVLPGKITNHDNSFDRIKTAFTPEPKQPTKPSESDQILNIEKFHKLKESGAISEDEFNKYKEEALKKIAG